MTTVKLNPQFLSQVEKRSERALLELGEQYVQTVEETLSGTSGRTGRTYSKNVGGRVVRHVASAPGEPPAELSGALRKGVGMVRGRVSRAGPSIAFGSSAPHGSAVTALRPEFWREALEKDRLKLLAAFRSGFREGS